MSHSGAENRAPLRTFRSPALKPFFLRCRKLATRVVVGLSGAVLAPALLWSVPAVGILALTAAITEGVRYPQAVVVLAFAGAFLTTHGYLLTTKERQPDEASLWATAALWLALLAAAVFDLADLVRGGLESVLVCVAGIAFFFAIWVPYLWSRRTVLPHAAAWTLAAAAAVPYALTRLLAAEVGAWDVFPPLAGAVCSAVAGFAAWAFASRRLPASARMVVLAAAIFLLGPVWIESPAASIEALGVPVAGVRAERWSSWASSAWAGARCSASAGWR